MSKDDKNWVIDEIRRLVKEYGYGFETAVDVCESLINSEPMEIKTIELSAPPQEAQDA